LSTAAKFKGSTRFASGRQFLLDVGKATADAATEKTCDVNVAAAERTAPLKNKNKEKKLAFRDTLISSLNVEAFATGRRVIAALLADVIYC
jgi:hypothetical protein